MASSDLDMEWRSDSSDSSTQYSDYEYQSDSDDDGGDWEDKTWYSSGAFQNAEYSDLDYETGDDMDDPQFTISMGTRSKKPSTMSEPEIHAPKGGDSQKKRTRAPVSDPNPLEPNKRRRTGGVKGKGPEKIPPPPPPAPKKPKKAKTMPISHPEPNLATKPAAKSGYPLESTMPNMESHPLKQKDPQDWAKQLLTKCVLFQIFPPPLSNYLTQREEEEELDRFAAQFFPNATQEHDLQQLQGLRAHIKQRVVIAARNACE